MRSVGGPTFYAFPPVVAISKGHSPGSSIFMSLLEVTVKPQSAQS
jgi:hypothetical protein